MTPEGTTREAVAARLEAVRAYYRIKTRRAFAEQAGIREQAYSDWMHGRRDVPRAGAEKLMKTYGLSYEYIYFGNKSHLPHNMAIAL